MALNSKESELRRGIIRRNSIWDKIVFRKVQEAFGGRLRLMVIGSAPLAGPVLTFTRCALGCLVVEGYGQTECVAAVTLTVQGDFVPDHVGPPVACCCLKVCDKDGASDCSYYLKYFTASRRCWDGILFVEPTRRDLHKRNLRVSGVRKLSDFLFYSLSNGTPCRYFKDPERTVATIDSNGWHHTGDIGEWLPNGTLKIIDRKKHIFKLSQGEYIVPEKIENIYIKSQYVEQVFVHGESLKVREFDCFFY